MVFLLATSFDEYNRPNEEVVFSGYDIVMVPKFPDEPSTTKKLLEWYGDVLERDFTLLGETKRWLIMRRTIFLNALRTHQNKT